MFTPALRIFALSLLLSLAPLGARAAICEPSQITSPTGLTFQIHENCSVLVGDARALETRGYLFTSDAELRVILSATSLHPISYLQGARAFYLFPRKATPPKVLANDGATLTIQTPTGLKAVFSHLTKELVSLTGFDVTVTPSLTTSREIQGGVTLRPKRGALLLDAGWAPFPFGSLNDPTREFQLVEWRDSSGRGCRSLFFELFSPTVLNDTHAFRYPEDGMLDEYLSEACPDLGWAETLTQ